MKTACLEIMLIDDIVLSAHAATVGAHESLSHIPGAALLGVVASKIYRALRPEDAFAVFHSGKVRFGNGLPLLGQMRTVPMPLAFHLAKAAKPISDGNSKRVAEQAYNLAKGEMPHSLQLRALREGFIDADGRRVTPTKTYRMKTAISAAEQIATEGQLFGYQALAAGQRFGAFITGDDSINGSLFSRITESLCGEVRFGRSRSAEYGRVRISERTAFTAFPVEAATSKVVLLAMSDLALVDEAGHPILTPSGAALGLPGAQVDFARTFVRSRSYAPYNAKRRAYDMERHVIVQGSVITLNGTFTADQIAALANGVGIHREAGLGEVLVNPALLANQSVTIEDLAADKAVGAEAVQPKLPRAAATGEGEAFIAWLRARDVGISPEMKGAFADAKGLLKTLSDHQSSARRYLGLLSGSPVGPSTSQWGTIYNAGKKAREFALLLSILRENIKENAQGWEEQFVIDKELTTFRTWFLAEAEKLANVQPQSPEANRRAITTIREFAKLAMDAARQHQSNSDPHSQQRQQEPS